MKQTEQKDGGFIDRILQAGVSSMLFRGVFSGANMSAIVKSHRDAKINS